ncbi:MAG: hypothetical protein WA154_04155 [Moraxellaceae bacterium]
MPKHLIIDTNLLLLLVIGAVEEGRHIGNSKRLKAFSLMDYDNILRIAEPYEKICITPYIATEVSNLIDLDGHARILAFQVARNLFLLFEKIEVNIDQDCESELFLEFGITDNSLIRLAPDYFILTSDYRMLDSLFKSSGHTIIPYYKVGI